MNADHAGKNDKIEVHVDPEIQDLIPGFLENRKQDVVLIPQALDKGDFETVRTIAHGMKGAGSGYGFEGISNIGSAMEQAALAKDEDEIRRQFEIFTAYLDRLEVIFDENDDSCAGGE